MTEHSPTSIAFTAPHSAATEAGTKILQQGGTAIEAMVAAAATIAVVYPHMNGLGGDGFWLISEPGKKPIAIDASGVAATGATTEFYQGHEAIPSRGGKAALTMAGAVAGWEKALEISHKWSNLLPSDNLSMAGLPLETLLNDAIVRATQGIDVTQSLEDASVKTHADLSQFDGFDTFLHQGETLKKDSKLNLSQLGNTLKALSQRGLQDFYTGEIAQSLAADLEQAGSPLRLTDFEQYRAQIVTPLEVTTNAGTLYNLPAPTQGIASLIILALYDRLHTQAENEADMAHLLIEATKQAFIARNQYVTDHSRLDIDLSSLLSEQSIENMVARISKETALPWPHEAKHGDTIWMGACDDQGRMVSYIQSLYWEFGSGIVSPSTGIVWNNRGSSFTLEEGSLQQLAPGLKPFHTLNPAFAELTDGRRISYGTMGGEGQPQTQAALFSRYIYHNRSLSESISDGRWLLGRTWGDQSHNLKIESDLADTLADTLKARGHDLVTVASRNELMGHAGAVVCHIDGATEAATDPRSDGSAFWDSNPR
ncbi:gamma-glutamyltransferase family protein [Marinomonas balearica]|nr:gamma-glutamyltransferase [Marinomonas balearica]